MWQPPATHVINTDLARVYRTPKAARGEDREADDADSPEKPKALVATLAWGDGVIVEEDRETFVKIRFASKDPNATAGGYLRLSRGQTPADVVRPADEDDVLKVNFVDVQQGDGTVIETPQGQGHPDRRRRQRTVRPLPRRPLPRHDARTIRRRSTASS